MALAQTLNPNAEPKRSTRALNPSAELCARTGKLAAGRETATLPGWNDGARAISCGSTPADLGRSGGVRTGRRGPGQRIEGAVDGGFGDVGEAAVAVAGVVPQPGEGLGQVDAGAL